MRTIFMAIAAALLLTSGNAEPLRRRSMVINGGAITDALAEVTKSN